MDIKEALVRIAELEADKKACDELIFMAQRDDKRGEFKCSEITLWAGKYQGHAVGVNLSDFYDLMNKRKREAQSEIDKLKPIIDMANAALRGIEK